MTIFNALTLVGGLCLFLFGMNLMGQALERRAGGKLRTLLDKMTSRVFVGFLTGLGITAIIQSSSATTVMVVGFVNSGLMTLRQAINVIMGANVGTTVTAWLLSLAGIDSGSTWVQLLKPSSFTPVLALIGIIFYMFCKSDKKKDTGTILLGFATLMFGMETSGIPLATVCAQKYGVPMVFAKKAKSDNIEGGLYQSEIFSYTYKKKVTLIVAQEWLGPKDRVLIIDDFMAKGYAMQGLIDIVKAAGAELVGIGVAVEKGFQHGGDALREKGYPIHSLAVIEEATPDHITFREDDPV